VEFDLPAKKRVGDFITEQVTLGLGLLLDMQVSQQRLWHDWSSLTDDERAALMKDLLLGLHEEASELQRSADRSRYHLLKLPPLPTREKFAEDVVDTLKYLLAIAALLGLDCHDLARAFAAKTLHVAERWGQEKMELKQTTRVLMVDIDGVLADWLGGFLAYLNGALGEPIDPRLVNHQSMDQRKDAFHASGGFKKLDVLPGAVETLTWIRSLGYKIALVTARPHRRFPNIYRDTVDWLEQAGIKYDILLFEREKDVVLSRLAPATILAHVEDRARHASEMAAAGVRVLKMPTPEDPHVEHPLITHVKDWDEVRTELRRLVSLDVRNVMRAAIEEG